MIPSIQPAFRSYVQDLVALNLVSNRLKCVEGGVLDSMDKLTHLDLSFNQISVFPYKEGQLSSLTFLSIKGNPIEFLPNFIQRSKLELLFFDWAFDPAYVQGKTEENIQEYIYQFDFKITKANLTELFNRYSLFNEDANTGS
jgi:hypothetical protein